MAGIASRINLGEVPPSAILTNLAISVPLFAVSRLNLSETYRVPPVGSTGFHAVVPTSSDRISCSALLVGPTRYLWKANLELLADISKRVDVLGELTAQHLTGIAFVSRLVTRTDLQVTELSFAVNTQRRDTIDVSIGLQHVPRPGPVDELLDVGTAAVASLLDLP